MWKIVCQSVPGTSHHRSGQPCQDHCTACEVPLKSGTALVLACSDGAGSAEHSQVGSRIACETIVQVIARSLHTAGELPLTTQSGIVEWVRLVHEALAAEAVARDVEMRQLACTLLFAVLGESGAAFGQIGDGVMIARSGDGYEHVLWPQSGEYANTTFFVTGETFEADLKCVWYQEPVDEVALLSDGLQTLALDFARRRAHGPFFGPLFEALRHEQQPENLLGPLTSFLESPAVGERTDDDKTLVLATRMSC